MRKPFIGNLFDSDRKSHRGTLWCQKYPYHTSVENKKPRINKNMRGFYCLYLSRPYSGGDGGIRTLDAGISRMLP